MMWDGFGYGMGWGVGILMVLFWALVIGLIIWLVVSFSRHNGGVTQNRSNSALEILKERYARGEINREEFEEKKKALS